jgi:hypothetical protein
VANGPQLSYATVISSLAFGTTLIGGIWVLGQSQIGNVVQRMDVEHKHFTEQLNLLREETQRRETELRAYNDRQDTIREAEIKVIHDELDKRRDVFVNIREYIEFKQRMLSDLDIIKGQLKVLETTRPTTGELQATTAVLRDRIDKLNQALTSQEEWIRSRPPAANEHRRQ